MANPIQIVEGFTNLAKAKIGIAAEQLEDHAIKRFDICKNCPKLTLASTCSVCGCFMPAKVRSTAAKCPIEKW